MSPTLLGGSAPGASTGGSTASSARNDSATAGTRRDFDAMLKGDSAGKSASRDTTATARPKAKPAEASSPPKDSTAKDNAAPPAADAGKDSTSSPSTASAASSDADKPTQDPTAEAGSSDAAPWPPLGLAGLALTGLTPPPTDPQLASPLPASTTASAPAVTPDALPAAPQGQAPATAPLGAPALAAATAGDAGPIALPLDATVSDDVALPKALADALAGNADADAPATPFLHALQTAAELKANAASAPFSGSPTATPHVGGDDFEDAMSARVGWLADQKIGHATIKVTPHDLGLIEVRLQMDGDKVHASFTSAHADVRHALESSMPRLREMLNDQGFQLGNADVGHQHTAQDGKSGSGGSDRGGFGGDGDTGLVETTVSPSQLMRQRGLLDAYA